MNKVALFADKGSVQIVEIAEAVTAEGGEAVVLDIQLGGLQSVCGRGVAGVAATVASDALRWQGIDLGDVRAAHVRCIAPRVLPVLPPILNARSRAEYGAFLMREQEFNAATRCFLEEMARRGALVANPLMAWVEHDTKGQFYEKLADWGFPVPQSLSTNDPERARRFIAEVGRAVVKPAVGIGSTRVVTESDLDRLDALRYCPALFQKFIEGDTIRVHIVGDTVVLSLRIITDGQIDSRTAYSGFECVALSAEQESLIVAANRRLGLHYAAWDIIRDKTGEIYYLDCNPGPFVMWIGLENRSIVFRQLARYLISYTRNCSVAEASSAVEAWRSGSASVH